MENPVRQGGWWYEVTMDDEYFQVLVDVPEGTKPLKTSEVIEVYDGNGNCINPSLDENDDIFQRIEILLDESGLLD